MNKTIALYEQDHYLKTCDSTLISAITKEDELDSLGIKTLGPTACLILDRTVFFPEGGGQPSDTGTISGEFGTFEVIYVFIKDDIIYHQIKLPEDGLNDNFFASAAGKQVSCRIDWEKRFFHMQRHCGEHILSAVFYDLYGGVNRGFHMGSDYMTIDISLENDPKFTHMNDEMIITAEWEANRMVWDNLPVTVRHFDSKKEAESLPMRKALEIEEDIVLVCVGDENKASGCVACCGTHPRYTGEVGIIKMYKWENYKGMVRITFDAGPNALKSCQSDGEILKKLCVRYSSEPDALLTNIKKRDDKNSEIRQELYELKQVHFSQESEKITEGLKNGGSVFIKKYDILKTDDLLKISKQLDNVPSDRLVALVSLKENTLILLSGGDQDCNKIVKDNASVWNGKGGGRPNSSRAMFPTAEDMDCFLDYLKKAY
ncbi:MAG TPA: alanine--tRNA ligase-related protein [Anaerovoracaceae bacterium]|nr:alanine--tRNA ligase-related protein [Anaerovoracaceae bacterium]